jgi:hypothetical protein
MIFRFVVWFLFVLVAAGPAKADEALKEALRGQGEDAITTAASVLVDGVREANPLGATGVLILKPVALAYVNNMDEPGRTTGLAVLSSVGKGAAANNICVFTAVLLELAAHGLTGGTLTAVCLSVGAFVGVQDWKSSEPRRLEAQAKAEADKIANVMTSATEPQVD